MRNPPFVFQSRNELLRNLRSDITKEHAEDFFSKRLQGIADVIRDSIAGNTFRAFRIYRNRHPSAVFREWASMHLDKTLEGLKSITDQESFGNYVHESALDLCTTWRSRMGTEIGYGRSTKLLNLALKKLACLNPTTIHMMSSRQWPVYVSGVRDKLDDSSSGSMIQAQ